MFRLWALASAALIALPAFVFAASTLAAEFPPELATVIEGAKKEGKLVLSTSASMLNAGPGIKTAVDGFMIDWIRPTRHVKWLDCEKQMWKELLGEPFPASGKPVDGGQPEKNDEDERGPGHQPDGKDGPESEQEEVDQVVRGEPLDDIRPSGVRQRFLEKADLGEMLGQVRRRGERGPEDRQDGQDKEACRDQNPFFTFAPRFGPQ